ncbi:MAG: hemolysin family protein [Spirochaetia bacterium]|nr:hemolysin family protein [Spirochaetia bacterium]
MDILLFVFLIILSAIFSGSEASLFSFEKSRLENLKSRKPEKTKWIAQWLNNPEKTLLAILLGNLAVNMIISEIGHTLIGKWAAGYFENISLISLISLTLVLLIFAEILPKIIALNLSQVWIFFFLPLLRFWFFISNIISVPMQKLTKFFTSKLRSLKISYKEKELTEAVRIAEKLGILPAEERKILHRAIAFYHDTAYSAMIPVSKVFMIPHNLSLSKVKKSFLEQKHPLALVYHEKEGNILGSLHVRNFISAIYKKKLSFRHKIQPILFLPETMPLNEVLQTFIKTRNHVAGVVDESGEFSGIVTLKDVLILLMGEWEDEYSGENGDMIKPAGQNIFYVSGEITLHEFNERFKCLFESENSETLSGYIIEKADGFPSEDSSVFVNNMEFFNIIIKNYKIQSLMLRLLK